ncbi:MAG: GcrA family cell cycle regulator [Methylocystis sp.]
MSSWTPQEDTALRAALAERMTAAQAAAHLTAVLRREITRSAVIGRAQRIGVVLCGRHPNNKNTRVITPKRTSILPRSHAPESHLSKEKRLQPRAERNGGVAPSKLKKAVLSQPMPEEIHAPASKRIGVMELRDSTCKWPIGDPRGADFGFCGAKPVDNCPYCAPHARIAYASIADRRRHDAFVRKGTGRLS